MNRSKRTITQIIPCSTPTWSVTGWWQNRDSEHPIATIEAFPVLALALITLTDTNYPDDPEQIIEAVVAEGDQFAPTGEVAEHILLIHTEEISKETRDYAMQEMMHKLEVLRKRVKAGGGE